MIKQLKSLQLSGVKRNKPQLSGELGDCEEIINLRFKGGAWRGVGKKHLAHTISADKQFTYFVKPACLPDGYYIGYCLADNAVYVIDPTWHYQSIYTLGADDTFKSIAYMNNTIIVYSALDVVAIQFMPGVSSMTDMFIQLPHLRMPKLGIGETTGEYLVSFQGGETTVAVNELDQDYFNTLIAGFLETYNKRRTDGFCAGNSSFYFAYNLFDGNYIMHSGPYIWNIGWHKEHKPQINRTYLSGDYNTAKWTMSMYMNKPAVFYEYAISYVDILQRYKDAGVLQSLCVFMTKPKSGYDVFDDKLESWTTEIITPGVGDPYKKYTAPFDDEMFKAAEDPTSYYLVKEYPIDELITSWVKLHDKITLDHNELASLETNTVLPVDSFSNHKLVPQTHYLYNSRLHIADIEIIPQPLGNPVLNWFYDGINAYTTVGRDATLRANYFGGRLPYYATNIFTTLGIHVYAHVQMNIDGAKYFITKEITDIYYNRVWKREDGGTFYSIGVRPLLSYPDIRAEKIMYLITMPEVDNNYRIMGSDGVNPPETGLEFALKPANFSNIGYHKQDATQFDGETYLPYWLRLPANELEYGLLPVFNEAATHVNLPIRQSNRMQTSEVNNLFFYPAKNSYRIGNPEYSIRALIVAQEQMSESQFGQYPLYAFTSEGIYAFEYQGGEVLYNRIHQFVNDVIQANSVPVAITGGAIVFMCEDGVRILQGRQTKLISEEITHRTHNPLIDQPLLIEMTSTASISLLNGLLDNTDDMKAYLHSCSIGYDAIEKELLFAPQISAFANDPNGFTLVFSLVNGTWSKRSDSFKGFIRDGNEYLAINNKVVESVNISDFYNLNVESGVMDKPWTFFQTRPFSFGSEVPKRMLQNIIRVTGENKAVYGDGLTFFVLTLPVNNALYGTTSGAGTYAEGDLVAILATPENGYAFVNWTENGEILTTDPSTSVQMLSNREITANFIMLPVSLPYRASMSVGAGPDYNMATDTNIAYSRNVPIEIHSPTLVGYNYFFVSVPTGRSWSIKNAMNIDITDSFSEVGTDIRPGFNDNTVFKKDDVYDTEEAVTFYITFN